MGVVERAGPNDLGFELLLQFWYIIDVLAMLGNNLVG